MCGILFTSQSNDIDDNIITPLKQRGPDATTSISLYGYTFVHTLLSMSQHYRLQPIIHDDIVILFNGEIYNYKQFGDEILCDTDAIITAYRIHGMHFAKYLDGEFAIIIYDHNIRKLFISTDIFGTKPLWADFTNLGACSYFSPLDKLQHHNIIQCEPNTTYIYDITYRSLTKLRIYNFDLRQYKTDYNDWINAFDAAITKRATNTKHNIFIGLSSGYDSGAIMTALLKQHREFAAYTILGSENHDIIQQRAKLLKTHNIYDIDEREYIDIVNEIKQYENYNMVIDNVSKPLYHDNGAIGLASICKRARANNQIIYLSGSGADEIYSDYGYNKVKHYRHSTLGGYYPTDLSKVFPWRNFYMNTQRAYLMKDEYIGGYYGIEARYPFLDKYVVQEFLNLHESLKNREYKAPIYYYLIDSDTPIDNDRKIGFNCGYRYNADTNTVTKHIATRTHIGITTDPSLITS